MKIIMNVLFVVLLATFLALAQLEARDQAIICRKIADVRETAAEWFSRVPHAKRGFINLHFYAHDTYTGPNATAYPVAKASITDKSPVGFGKVTIFDSPLYDRPDLTTAVEIGRVQGTDTMADFDEKTAVSSTTFLFKKIYCGSTVSILGRVKQDVSAMSEFPVVGGTGIFRGARGTATLTTVSVEPIVVDCNLYFEYYL